MDVAQVIIQLAAHKEVVDAEVKRIESDIDFMLTAKSKYEIKGQKSFSTPTLQLKKALKLKQQTSEEIRQQLDLYQLHFKSGAVLLRKLNKEQNTMTTPADVSAGGGVHPSSISIQY